jgi:GNAT superfamily N-acetyltransferase
MDVTRHASAAELIESSGGFLAEREAEHNLPLGIIGTLRDHPDTYPEPAYLATVRDQGRIALVAVRTPPFGIVLSEPGVPEDRIGLAVDALIGDLRAGTSALPTAAGPKSTVGPFARSWSIVTGHPARMQMAERIYRLSRVLAPRPTPGAWRVAGAGDRALLREWLEAFDDEALPRGSPRFENETMVERWVRRDDRFAYLWEVDGRVVSLVAAGARTPSGRRIGPVYTPPGERGRGYASALTAAASQDQLDHGARFCFLFTDLANPTSNSIYQQIGYEPVSDIDQYGFDVGATAAGNPPAG